MKKLIAVCFCLSTFLIANSQIRIGVKAGLNLNHPIGGTKSPAPTGLVYDPDLGIISRPLTGTGTDRFELNANLHAGFTADIPITEKFHIRPDLLFTRRVTEIKQERKDDRSSYVNNGRFTANYIELPVHFVYYHKTKSVAYYIGGGPYIAYALSGKANSYTVSTTQGNNLGEYESVFVSYSDEKDWYKKMQLGAVIALGVDLPFGLTGELSVHHGLTDINKSKLVNRYSRVINFNYGLSVGYLLGKKKS